MKTAMYIIGILIFSIVVVKKDGGPKVSPSKRYETKEREISLKEKHIDQTIIELEANIAINEAKIEIQANNAKLNKK